jgi:Protein of unknown function (DUF992)
MKLRLALRAAVAAAVCGVVLAPMAARADVEAGTLGCRGGGAVGLVVTSVHHFECVFRPASGGPPQRYVATIRKVGVDLGFTRGEALGWLVFAPARGVGPGELAGSYGGVQAGASVVVGVGANGLVGGLGNSFALQPVSVEAQKGLNVAGGFAGLELQYVGEPRPRHIRHRHRR